MRIPPPTTKRRVRIEIIPLIDVVFFLLATFVMVSLSMVKNRGIPVHLPAAATGTAQARTSTVTITLTERGELYLNKQVVSPDELAQRLAELKAKHAEGQVPRPPHWGGYRLIPQHFEFWQGRTNRLHDRFVYTLKGDKWEIVRLSP